MNQYQLTDDAHERLGLLLKARVPWLLVGLIGGIVATFLVSSFEKLLSSNIALAFFLPLIVYMSDAVGTQTETVYVRNLAKFRDNFLVYLAKEIMIGISFGTLFGILLGAFAYVWLGSVQIATTIGIAMLINAIIAPVVALIVPEILFKEHTDPALGGGPFTTIIQEIISLVVYFVVAIKIII